MMGLMNGIAGLFGLSHTEKKQKVHIHEAINFMDGINAHVKCKVHLLNHLNGSSAEPLDPAVIGRDDQCVLGKWIHGPAFRHFHMSPIFYQLRSQHAQMHHIAGNIVEHVQANNRAAAEALMEGKYKDASRKVMKALTELNQSAKA